MVWIIYVRHGESISNKLLQDAATGQLNISAKELIIKLNQSDSQLTEKGKLQAQLTANHLHYKLSGKDISVWRSTLIRTIQTSDPFINRSRIKQDHICTMKLLEEYSPGTSYDEFAQIVKTFNDSTLKPFILNGTQEQDRTLVIFGHAIFLSTLINYQINQEDFCHTDDSIQLPNCSITVMSYEKNEIIIKWKHHLGQYINHLGPLLATGYHTNIGFN